MNKVQKKYGRIIKKKKKRKFESFQFRYFGSLVKIYKTVEKVDIWVIIVYGYPPPPCTGSRVKK